MTDDPAEWRRLLRQCVHPLDTWLCLEWWDEADEVHRGGDDDEDERGTRQAGDPAPENWGESGPEIVSARRRSVTAANRCPRCHGLLFPDADGWYCFACGHHQYRADVGPDPDGCARLLRAMRRQARRECLDSGLAASYTVSSKQTGARPSER